MFSPALAVMLKGLMELIASFNVVDMMYTSYEVRLTNLLLFGKVKIVWSPLRARGKEKVRGV